MSANRSRLLAIGVILAGFVIWHVSDDPKSEIRRVLDEFEVCSKIAGPEHPLETLKHSRTMAEHASDSVAVEFEHDGERRIRSVTKEEIIQHLAGARRRLNFFDGRFEKPIITVTGDTAEVAVRGQGTGSMPGVEGQFFEQRELTLSFRKVHDVWVVEKVVAGPPFS